MQDSLSLHHYRAAVHLDEQPQISIDESWPQLLHQVLRQLGVSVPQGISPDEALRILHGVLAPIDPNVLNDELVDAIEVIAAANNSNNEIVDSLTLPTIAEHYQSRYPAGSKTSIWTGDITKLNVDVIVNAANTELLGCRIPNHACIDNVIHSAAGPRLRDDCAVIIEKLRGLEKAGNAKITRAYALPSNYVLHTVGPQLRSGAQPTAEQQRQLINSYKSCLDLAAEVENIRSIAFCAVSTGLFAYPKKQAAQIALETVAVWLTSHPERFDRVIFNLYSKEDAQIYEDMVNDW